MPEVLDQATPTSADAGTYEGGHGSHTGQLYFDDAISDHVFAAGAAYAGRDNTRRLRAASCSTTRFTRDDPKRYKRTVRRRCAAIASTR
jgi:hypothetical protein